MNKVFSVFRKILSSFTNLIAMIIDHSLASIPSLIRASFILNKKLNQKQIDGISNKDIRLKISEKDLREFLESDIKRLERIEDKAKSTVLGVALSVSLASPSILLLVQADVFADESYYLRLTSAIILIIATLFLIISGYLSLSGYKAGRVFLPQPRNHAKLAGTKEAQKNLLKCIELNQIRVIQNANLLSASMDCLRNGLFLVLIFFVLAIISALF